MTYFCFCLLKPSYHSAGLCSLFLVSTSNGNKGSPRGPREGQDPPPLWPFRGPLDKTNNNKNVYFCSQLLSCLLRREKVY